MTSDTNCAHLPDLAVALSATDSSNPILLSPGLAPLNSERGIGKAADRAGLNTAEKPRLSMHDLRHTFASHLIRSGVDVAAVSRQLGHSRPSITLDIYSHEFDQARNGDALREHLAAAFGD